MKEMQDLLSEMERSVIWIREIIRVGGMSDEDEGAISRVIDQLIYTMWIINRRRNYRMSGANAAIKMCAIIFN